MNKATSYHEPVLLQASIDHLNIRPKGTYVDLTFGGGGHTREILRRLVGGHVWAFDQDPSAKLEAEKIEDPRLHFIAGNFRYFATFLRFHGLQQVDGILADLGVSSHQFDKKERGFAVRLEGPLDMRMHRQGDFTAAKLLNTYSTAQLAHIFRHNADVPNATKLAQSLVWHRKKHVFSTIGDLKTALAPFLPKGREFKYYAKIFQAIRIAVNDEYGALEAMLMQVPEILKPNGRVVMLTYHSGEDRRVKNFFKTGDVSGTVEKDFYGNLIRPLVPLSSKLQRASDVEVAANNRARSAGMRVAIKKAS